MSFNYRFCLVILNAVKDPPFIYDLRRFFASAQNDKMIVILHFAQPYFKGNALN